MKRIIPLLLLFTMLLQCSMRGIIVGYFVLNQAYIAEKLCENRSKPAMCCRGKCYLKKQLDKEAAANNLSKQLKDKLEQWFDVPVTATVPGPCLPLATYIFGYVQKTVPGTFTSIFHPPPIA